MSPPNRKWGLKMPTCTFAYLFSQRTPIPVGILLTNMLTILWKLMKITVNRALLRAIESLLWATDYSSLRKNGTFTI